MSVLVPVLIVLVLIVLNGLFVAAEFAIVGAPRAAVERRAAEGSRAARLVQGILEDPRQQDRFIATAQLGITLASLGLGMYGEHLLAGWIAAQLEGWGAERWIAAHTVGSIVAVAVLTYFHIVLGEMVPKSLALQRALDTVLWIAPVMRVIQLVVYPLVLALNGIGNGLLKLFGVDRAEATHTHIRTPEELAYLVRESQAGGLLRKESAHVVHELFEFSELTAGEAMVPRVHIVGLPLGADRDEVCRVLAEDPHTRYPVYEESLDQIVGVVHVKELLRWLSDGTPLGHAEARAVPFVPTTVELDQVMAIMRQARAEMVVVLDEYGGTAGLITVEDLFEEVVGEFGDAAVGHHPELYVGPTGRLHVAGTVRLEEVGEALGVVLEHEDVDTTSGLVLAELGRPPVVGDAVVFDGVRFEVAAVEGHGVAEAVVAVVPAEQEG